MIDPEQRGLLLGAARGLLSAGAGLYGIGACARNALYERGVRKARRAGAPVISVGNITAGGTGKTPFVAWLSRLLRIHKCRPAVLSRGYGKSAKLGVDDENELLSRHVPEVPVVVDPDRLRGAERAVREHGADVLILDDGFQHRRLARDLDIVLIDAALPFGGGHLLPRGLLREPLTALKRAGFFVITRSDLVGPERLDEIKERLAEVAPRTPVAECIHLPSGLREVGAEEPNEDESCLLTNRWLAFCGIGNPDGFRGTLRNLAIEPAAFHAFPDHHVYRPGEVADLVRQAADLHCDGLLTTEKDAIKIERVLSVPLALPIVALQVCIDFPRAAESLCQAILRAVGKQSA